MTTFKASAKPPSTLLTLRDLCQYTQTPASTMYQLLSRGAGPTSLKIGRNLRFRPSDIDAWLDGLAHSTAAGDATLGRDS
ncbi:helix-turn-helix transcriptional regulator [Microbacterium hatanonis]|uniref:Helix-turn-helix domain-containing protein n=1 Tax=Microbacterium hatanonis TaxID=404366 RepID=A0A5C8I4I9_9MICO|nr:helix-turn-helix domain-containing protein [Microbacterium hatanonis]TXK13091.1 helix-turn-helix domain-containing protein [Microbacterium hatanonis]